METLHFLRGENIKRCYYFKLEDISPFCGPLIILFWTSGDIFSGFQSQGGSPHLHAPSPVSNRIFRFTSGTTPADLLAASMAADPFSSTVGTCKQALYKKCVVMLTNMNFRHRFLEAEIDKFVTS